MKGFLMFLLLVTIGLACNFSGIPASTGGGVFIMGGNRFSWGKDFLDQDWITGGTLIYTWSQIEPEEGKFCWNIIEDDIYLWTSHNKRVSIRVMTSYHREATPHWVYKAGARRVGRDPVFWDDVFYSKWSHFVEAFAHRFDGNPAVEFIEITGTGRWGETFVPSWDNPQKWLEAGYNQELYITHIKRVIDLFRRHFKSTPLVIQLSHPFPNLDPKGEHLPWVIAEYAVERGLYLKQNALVANYSYDGFHWMMPKIFHRYRNRTKLIYETGSSVSGGRQFQGSMVNTVLRGLIDYIDYLLIYPQDACDPATWAGIKLAASKLPQQDLGHLWIRFAHFRSTYRNGTVREWDNYEYGIEESRTSPTARHGIYKGIPWKGTSPSNPFIDLDISDELIEDGISKMDIFITYIDEGRDSFALLYHPKNAPTTWREALRIRKTGTGLVKKAHARLTNFAFPHQAPAAPESDLRLSSLSDGDEKFLLLEIFPTPPLKRNFKPTPSKRCAYWIWDNGGGGVVGMRRTFFLPMPPVSAKIKYTSDEYMELFINGKKVDEKGGCLPIGEKDITPYLIPHRLNTLAIKARDKGKYVGVLIECEIKFVGGKSQYIVSDASWRVSRNLEGEAWLLPNFNDNLWQPAHIIGPSSLHPWSIPW